MSEHIVALSAIVAILLTMLQALPVRLHTPTLSTLDLRRQEVTKTVQAGNWSNVRWDWP